MGITLMMWTIIRIVILIKRAMVSIRRDKEAHSIMSPFMIERCLKYSKVIMGGDPR
jgi:hypothetical protein